MFRFIFAQQQSCIKLQLKILEGGNIHITQNGRYGFFTLIKFKNRILTISNFSTEYLKLNYRNFQIVICLVLFCSTKYAKVYLITCSLLSL